MQPSLYSGRRYAVEIIQHKAPVMLRACYGQRMTWLTERWRPNHTVEFKGRIQRPRAGRDSPLISRPFSRSDLKEAYNEIGIESENACTWRVLYSLPTRLRLCRNLVPSCPRLTQWTTNREWIGCRDNQGTREKEKKTNWQQPVA